MKALGLVVLDKKIFENCNLKTYFSDLVTYLCNQLKRLEQLWLNLVKIQLAVLEDKSSE